VDEYSVATPEQAETLPAGQWVVDATGAKRCLVDTYVGWPQRMWMTCGGESFTAIYAVAYPLTLVYIADETPCPHAWGNTGCGHCNRCGVVVAEARPWRFETAGLLAVRAAVGHNARLEETHD
jgi:hypothetical protein